MKHYLFFLIFLLVMALANFYIYHRFLKRLHFAHSWGIKLIPLLLFCLQLLFVAEILSQSVLLNSWTFYLSASSIGAVFLLLVVSLLYDLIHTSSQRVKHFDIKGRRSIKVIFDVCMIILAFTYLSLGVYSGIKEPVLNTVNIYNTHFKVNNFTIAQLSDVHVGRLIEKKFVQQCVERINTQQVDMVVITGDLVDMDIKSVMNELQPLADLKSRFGTFFVLGNHEYFHGAADIVAHLKTLNITPLLNESRLIGEGQQAFNLVGINDLVSTRIGVLPYDIEQAFHTVDKKLATLLLSHQPKSVKLLQDKNFDLMLSGRTHGGQIFPFGALVMMDQPYLAGLYQINQQKNIFVSRGTGYWGPPIRVFAPSEISLLTINPS